MIVGTGQLEGQLAGAVGTEHVRVEGNSVVVAPAGTEQVAEALRIADAAGASVKAMGAGTKQEWYGPLDAAVVLETARMDAVREHAAQDLTTVVDAGCTWAAMQRRLAMEGQSVALDPLWPERATVGGIVAANDSGALRLRYGSLRDLIIGMTVVLADGTAAKSGGKVVKNVAGYDMHKLMTGAAGTLGVITQVNFRLHPREKFSRSWSVRSPDASALAGLMHRLRDSYLLVSAMQLRAEADAAALDVMFAAGMECLEQQAESLRVSAMPLRVEEAAEGVWQARERLFEDPDAMVVKVSVLPMEIAMVAARLRLVAEAEGVAARVVAQATGLVTASLAGEAETCAKVAKGLRAEVEARGGSLAVLRMKPEMEGSMDRWGLREDTAGSPLALMKRVKSALDPKGTLNPGRFVGGI